MIIMSQLTVVTVKPCLILSPGKPTIRLHIFCFGFDGHLEITMSPFSSLCNLTDIRSMSNTSLVYSVGSMDGPVHCNVQKFNEQLAHI